MENENPIGDASVTRVLNAAVKARTQSGAMVMIQVRGERLGPPARAVHSPDTSFRIVTRGDSLTGQHHATSLWEALTEARLELEQHGIFLLIAASRRDSYATHASRYADTTVVNRLEDPDIAEGFLVDAPLETVGTVAEQHQNYLQWLHRRRSAPDTTP